MAMDYKGLIHEDEELQRINVRGSWSMIHVGVHIKEHDSSALFHVYSSSRST